MGEEGMDGVSMWIVKRVNSWMEIGFVNIVIKRRLWFIVRDLMGISDVLIGIDEMGKRCILCE